jgi:hypothetical protein
VTGSPRPGELMPPAATHRQADVAVCVALVDVAAAGTRLGCPPTTPVALDPDHQRQAVAALLELLTAALGRYEAAEPSPLNYDC